MDSPPIWTSVMCPLSTSNASCGHTIKFHWPSLLLPLLLTMLTSSFFQLSLVILELLLYISPLLASYQTPPADLWLVHPFPLLVDAAMITQTSKCLLHTQRQNNLVLNLSRTRVGWLSEQFYSIYQPRTFPSHIEVSEKTLWELDQAHNSRQTHWMHEAMCLHIEWSWWHPGNQGEAQMLCNGRYSVNGKLNYVTF